MNDKLRVLHVIGGMNRAGAESMMMSIFRTIDRSRFQFDFLVYNTNEQDYEAEIARLGGRVIHTSPGRSPMGMVRTVREVMRREGPYDAVHCATLFNSAWALVAARWSFPAVLRVTHSHNTRNVVAPSMTKRVYERVAAAIIRRLTQVPLACGREAGRFLFGKRIFDKRGTVLLNSVDLNRFANVAPERREALANEFNLAGKMVITSVARFNTVKNHALMVEMARELKARNADFAMLLVGQGELEADIRARIARYGLDDCVTLTGVRGDIPEILSVTDLFIMPSFFEGNPVSIIEAQAAGCPCLISDTITPGIDIGLGLIGRLSPTGDTPARWAEAALASGHREIPIAERHEALCRAGYDLEATTRLLCDIYTRKK